VVYSNVCDLQGEEHATLKFTSQDLATGVLDVKIQADSVNTGSGMKDGELKGDKFFDVKKDPYITFHSTKLVQTGPHTFDAQGTFTTKGRWRLIARSSG